jgi:MFS transporter, DHA2 family, multidrug resistance protein
MGHWDLDVGTYALAIPIILSGAGSGFIFPTLSATTLSCVEKERMGYASSLYNMMRNTGSAIGISLVTNLLNSLEQKHQSYLVDHVSIFDAWRLSGQGARMPGAPTFNYAQELATNQRQGLGMLYHTVQSQASLLAYNDIYRMLAIMGALFIPSFLMLKKTAGRAPAGH